jgi:hypothetical protein
MALLVTVVSMETKQDYEQIQHHRTKGISNTRYQQRLRPGACARGQWTVPTLVGEA